jgi:hypothetical protein
MEVGELKKASLKDFIKDCGGIMIILPICLSIIYTLWRTLKDSSPIFHLKILTLSIFTILCIALTIPAERFQIFALIGLFLFLALGLNFILEIMSRTKTRWIVPVTTIALSIILAIKAEHSVRTSITPIFNSVWEEALLSVRNNTPKDSIINGWWPPGHFVKAISQRKVMFDGASLSEGPTGYWMANALLSSNEKQAAGIFRMINLSRNNAVDFLIQKGLKTSQAVALLKLIASKNDAESAPILQAILKSSDDVQSLLKLTRGGNPSSYILLYNELVDHNIGLNFMGKWNIERIEEINENPKLLAQVPPRNSADYIDFLWSLAGGQSHYSPPLASIGEDESKIYFKENLVIDKASMTAAIDSPIYGRGSPLRIFYLDQGKQKESKNLRANLGYSVVIYKQNSQLTARLMDNSLADSILIKLFFFDAQGMTNFKLLNEFKDLSGRTSIKIFKIDW